jgi:hypothetical protein
MSQRGPLVDEDPRIVWPAMREQIAHPDDTVAVVGVKPIKGNEASDSAHAGRSSRPSSIAAVYSGP